VQQKNQRLDWNAAKQKQVKKLIVTSFGKESLRDWRKHVHDIKCGGTRNDTRTCRHVKKLRRTLHLADQPKGREAEEEQDHNAVSPGMYSSLCFERSLLPS
jgi:hypothetical protein